MLIEVDWDERIDPILKEAARRGREGIHIWPPEYYTSVFQVEEWLKEVISIINYNDLMYSRDKNGCSLFIYGWADDKPEI